MHNHWYSKGKLHIVWYTGKEGTPGIYYAVSSDKGETFSKPLPIFNGTWVPPLKSSLAVDRYNNTWIAWEDIAELEKKQQQQQQLRQPQSQLHNSSANPHLQQDPQNQ
jgi:hypothetical protein